MTTLEWSLLVFAALGIGISKTGLAGISMVHVIIFAHLFDARESTGIVLPMLICADIAATIRFGHHAQWKYIGRVIVPAFLGVILGWLVMDRLDKSLFGPLIGIIILFLTALQAIRIWKPEFMEAVPHLVWFGWLIGILVGFTTMVANAAGPIFAIFLLALSIPKMHFVGTSAWFFLILNLSKVPFSWSLGLIDTRTLTLNLVLLPAVLIGFAIGQAIVPHIPKKYFDTFILAFTALAAIKLLWE